MSEPADAPNPFASMATVFVEPGRTFERLVARPTWWAPLVVSCLLGVVFTFVLIQKMDVEKTVRQSIEARSAKSGSSVPEEQVKQAVAIQEKLKKFYPAFGLAGTLIVFFLVGLVYWGSVRAFGSEARFGQVLSVHAYAGMPMMVASVFALAMLFSAPDTSLTQQQLQTLVKSNPGAFLGDESPAPFRALLSSFDLFTMASLALLIIGFRRLPQLGRGAAMALPLGLWGVWIAIRVGWAALFG